MLKLTQTLPVIFALLVVFAGQAIAQPRTKEKSEKPTAFSTESVRGAAAWFDMQTDRLYRSRANEFLAKEAEENFEKEIKGLAGKKVKWSIFVTEIKATNGGKSATIYYEPIESSSHSFMLISSDSELEKNYPKLMRGPDGRPRSERSSMPIEVSATDDVKNAFQGDVLTFEATIKKAFYKTHDETTDYPFLGVILEDAKVTGRMEPKVMRPFGR